MALIVALMLITIVLGGCFFFPCVFRAPCVGCDVKTV